MLHVLLHQLDSYDAVFYIVIISVHDSGQEVNVSRLVGCHIEAEEIRLI